MTPTSALRSSLIYLFIPKFIAAPEALHSPRQRVYDALRLSQGKTLKAAKRRRRNVLEQGW